MVRRTRSVVSRTTGLVLGLLKHYKVQANRGARWLGALVYEQQMTDWIPKAQFLVYRKYRIMNTNSVIYLALDSDS